ncbi:MAG: two-component sensor histidine kinase [Leptolyngbyaceae cyanobacterium RM1_1_2]|nr:two-component sensor histidine kinase [Leptolyngbyaceae cyanobacterium RM1_1_2]
MFEGLRWRLLTAQLLVMASILGSFSLGAYLFFSRSLYQQLDKKLQTLAQAASPSFAAVALSGEQYLTRVNEVPWRDIFNRDSQSLEWFDNSGDQLTHFGNLTLQPKFVVGPQTLTAYPSAPQAEQAAEPVRTFTISVFEDGSQFAEDNNSRPVLQGYIRASQSLQDIRSAQRQLILGLGTGGAIALGLIGLGGLWLTQRSLRPVEQSFNQLKQFTADASHELRGPLTAIKTSIDVIQNHPERIHPKDAKKLSAIADAAGQMQYLTEDLLLLARMEAPATAGLLQRERLCLRQLLQTLVELLESSAQLKNIQLTLAAPQPVHIIGDRRQLSRLYANLIENAIRYTLEGGQVQVSLSKKLRLALVQVSDSGIGIAPADIPHVFDRFWRADKARSRKAGGSGLGLAICQAIARRHGGKISVCSRLGAGSRFRVSLPLASSSGRKTLTHFFTFSL